MENIQSVQQAYLLALRNEEDVTIFIQTLIHADYELSEKYLLLDMEKLIELNSQNVDQLHRISIALSILEKYTRHLLKPEENRSNMWKYVKFSNQIFKDRVDAIQGGRDLMKTMGYTKDIKDGLAFPDDGKTDPNKLTKMLAGILLGKQELSLYLTRSHPHRECIDRLLPHSTIIELRRFHDKLHMIDPSSVRETSINQQSVKQDRRSPDTASKQVTPAPPSGTVYQPTPEQNLPNQMSPRQLTGQSPYNYVTGIQSTQSQQSMTAISQPAGHSQQPLHNPQPSLGRIDSNQIPIVAKLMAQGKSISSEDIERSSSTSTSVSKTFAISSEESPVISPAVSVPHTQAPQTSNYNSANDSMHQTSAEESVFPSGSACDICGNRQAEIICEICDNKQLCYDCDDKWHQHPRRQNHKRQNMAGDLVVQQPTEHRHNRTDSQGEATVKVDPNKSLTNVSRGGGDDVYVTAHYNPPESVGAEKQPEVSYIINRMQNLGMEGYSRARALSSGETGMVDMPSHAIEPYSVQTGNWYGQHQAPQVYSHQTNLVRPVQLSGSPVSHLSSGMSSGGSHFYGNQQPQGSLVGQQFIQPQRHYHPISQSFQPGTPVQQQNISTTAPGGPPTSRLLPGIMAIPDLQRRRSKIEINLITLREEIEDVETKINELIAQNPHFYSDPEYASLYKRKGVLTREKIELERYEKNMEQSIREEEQSSMVTRKGSSPDVLSQPVIYPPTYGTPSHIPSQPQLINPSSGFHLVYVQTSNIGGSMSPETYSLVPTTNMFTQPTNLQYPQAFTQANRPSEYQGVYQSPPNSQNFVRQPQQGMAMQPKFDNRNMPTQPVPSRQHVAERKIENIPPVSVQKPLPKHQETLQLEEKQNQQNNLKQSPPVPHRGLKPHSYVNVPKLPKPYSEDDKHQLASAMSDNARTWICSHCTFHNTNPSHICGVCSKTSKKPRYIDEEVTMVTQVDPINKPDQNDAVDDENETAVLEVGKHIGEVHDQIYMEKVAAKREYKERMEKERKQQAALKSVLPKPKLPDPILTIKAENLPVDTSPKHINRPKDPPLSGGMVESPFSGERLSGPLSTKNFANTMEEIQRKKAQEEMTFEGKKLLKLMKNFEKDGVDADEVELAVELANDKPVDKWLKEKWMPLVDRVIHMATNQGAQMEQNDVGELSVIESKEALKENECDVGKAARQCVEQRKKLYKGFQDYGCFAREDILQAMLHSQGNLESAVDELNSKWLQLFNDRVWQLDENAPRAENLLLDDHQRDRDLAIARATSEICNSVTNSVLSYVTFQSLVKDKNIDLERRIRLILVEGKLQSWGRAEIVIRILDEEVAKNKLEASLEEVVEAVRNCGDRASSLVFLKQYCEICYAQFPMTKIRNLGCSCKICVHCVRENFEITIREKHVRNMSCPLCSQPNMENVEAASDYLSFLTMLLQTLVSQEIMELYHSKLRDWHLQKDPNFRWCVHCGNGFIWAAGNQTLKMDCPTCKKGTCFSCKKLWEDQHDGLTCDQYAQWKIDNDPENQTAGLARYLEDNGIDCPSCKMKYSLAKGGCMHFKCPQCGYEFCSGCSQPFYQKGVCRKYNSCVNKGLHCHHPRNCLYYLRDEDFDDLQKVLKDKKIQFNTTAPEQEGEQTCPVMEQKEDPEGKRDEACGRDVQEGFAGLCPIHYKEYLVSLINKRNVDPLAIMSLDAMKRLIEREEKKVIEKKPNESDAKYRKRLEQFIREIEPLNRQD